MMVRRISSGSLLLAALCLSGGFVHAEPAETATLKSNAARTIAFVHPLPRMKADDVSVGDGNSGTFAVPGVATTGDGRLATFVWNLRKIVQNQRRKVFVDGRALTCSINWIRDHIHQSKGFRHWEHDLTSFLGFILDTQRDDGQFYEMLLPLDRTAHWKNSSPNCRRLYEDDFISLVRFEIEADIEYLMVEGSTRVWRATGNDAWLKAALPRLEKGIDYLTGAPKRWDAAHGLVKRGYTIDTWDFTFRPDPDTGADLRRIIPGYTPMGIMHGDNTGVCAAMKSLAAVNRRFGDVDKAVRWERRAEELRGNLMKHLWNGTFFRHQLPTDGFAARDGIEARRLSLSNAYALNRGVLSLAERRSVIGEYMRRRSTTEAFAEWFTIDPPYDPTFGENGKFPKEEYVNGTISPFAAGELAKGAFESGYEEYGWDIIARLQKLVEENGGSLGFLYHPRNRAPQGRGPSGWGAAAILDAIDEGLAGIRDVDVLYRKIAFSPRWPVTPYNEVRYITGYEVSSVYVDCRYVRTDRGFRYNLRSPAREIQAHLLMPRAATPRLLLVDGIVTSFSLAVVGESRYVDVAVSPSNGVVDFEVLY